MWLRVQCGLESVLHRVYLYPGCAGKESQGFPSNSVHSVGPESQRGRCPASKLSRYLMPALGAAAERCRRSVTAA